MRVLIAGESSGVTRDAFLALGHDAMSCDLLPTERPGPHHQGDVRGILVDGWDLMIAHPDCTYLTNSAAWAYGDGPYHQKVKPETPVGIVRRKLRLEALAFVQLLMDAPVGKIAIENPVGVISTAIRKADQYIQPHEFGHDASKKTGLWLKNLPLLKPTLHIAPRSVCSACKDSRVGAVALHVFGYGCANCGADHNKIRMRWANQTDSGQNRLTPGPDRWKERARTYQGWADAMALRWGGQV